MSERPYTIATAAQHLACSTATVRKLIRAGRLRHYRLGGGATGPIRIPAAAMEELENGAQTNHRAPANAWDRLIDAYKS